MNFNGDEIKWDRTIEGEGQFGAWKIRGLVLLE